jgi:hypothetical protein
MVSRGAAEDACFFTAISPEVQALNFGSEYRFGMA